MTRDEKAQGQQEVSGSANDLVLIWSMEHDAWWRPNARGYTANREEAGHFGRREAQEIVDSSRGVNERIVELTVTDQEHEDSVFFAKVARLVRAAASVEKWAGAYFRMYGSEHTDPDCPEDDTCRCQPVHEFGEALAELSRAASEVRQ